MQLVFICLPIAGGTTYMEFYNSTIRQAGAIREATTYRLTLLTAAPACRSACATLMERLRMTPTERLLPCKGVSLFAKLNTILLRPESFRRLLGTFRPP